MLWRGSKPSASLIGLDTEIYRQLRSLYSKGSEMFGSMSQSMQLHCSQTEGARTCWWLVPFATIAALASGNQIPKSVTALICLGDYMVSGGGGSRTVVTYQIYWHLHAHCQVWHIEQ